MKDREPDNRFLFEENGFKDSKKTEDTEDHDFRFIEKLNRKVSVFLNPKSINITDEERKKRLGTILTTLIILVLIISTYYFLVYEPSQESLEHVKTDKLNELHSLYTGPLSTSADVHKIEKQIESANNEYEVKKIDVMGPATKAWRNYLNKAISIHQDSFNRTMEVLRENNTTKIMPAAEAYDLINGSSAKELSKIDFKTPNTVTVPVLISRLQAGGGLLSVGSIVNIYTMSGENSNGTNHNNTNNIVVEGCTIVAILRCDESGEIESEYSSTHNIVQGNNTNPNEDSKTFTTNVLELIKSSIANGNDEIETLNILKSYGVRLSNCEREINLGDLDAQYIVLVEIPSDKTNFILENMEQIIMTIPTTNAPDWMVNEISSTYV